MSIWPSDRREELGELLDMIQIIKDINKGSRAIDNINIAIEIADKLGKVDLENSRLSFTAFLLSEALKGN